MRKKIIISLIIALTPGLAIADDLLEILSGKTETTESLVEEKQDVLASLKQTLQPSAEQNIFFAFFNSENYEKALFQWPSAFGDSKFSSSSNGHALLGYLLFKNGLRVVGLERLFQAENPNDINPTLKTLWKSVAPPSITEWSYVSANWNDKWTNFFDRDTEVAYLSHQIFDVSNSEKILDLLKKSKTKSASRSWLEWQMALSLALNGDIAKSAQVLAHLLKNENAGIDRNLIHITAARLLYEQGYLEAAISYYEKVPKTSEYWFTAQEERAWAYIRKGEPHNTIAVAKSLAIPEFYAHVGPELVFLQALAQLKICDYGEAAKSLEFFKTYFQPRAKSMLDLQQQGMNPASTKLVEGLKKGRLKLLSLGEAAKDLPRYVSNDEALYHLVQAQVALEKEVKLAEALYARSLSGGTAKVGFQGQLADLKMQVAKRLEAAKSASFNLIKTRAKEELNEIQQTLQKMHIVEAEVIQQIALAGQVAKATQDLKQNQKLGSTVKAAKYDLKFPDDGEKWFDEIGNYKVDVKKFCQTNKAAIK